MSSSKKLVLGNSGASVLKTDIPADNFDFKRKSIELENFESNYNSVVLEIADGGSPLKHLSVENDLDQKFIQDNEPYNWKDYLVTWALFICVLWMQFGVAYAWVTNFSFSVQTKMLYNISGYKFRVLNEVMLYVYASSGLLGTYLSGINLKLNILLACVLLSVGYFMVF